MAKKDAVWWREYRAKKKLEEMQTLLANARPLFVELANLGAPEPSQDARMGRSPEGMQPQTLQAQLQLQPVGMQAQPTPMQPPCNRAQGEQEVVQLIRQEVEAAVGDLILFPEGTKVAQPKKPLQPTSLQAQPEAATLPELVRTELTRQLKAKLSQLETACPESAKVAGLKFLPLTIILAVAAIGLFLIANTAFLVREQVGLYIDLGYSLAWALVVSVLSELALITFSGLGASSKGWRLKLSMYGASIATAAMILGALGASVDQRASGLASQSEEVQSLKSRLASLEALKAAASEDLTVLDPKAYPTRRNELRAQIKALDDEAGQIGGKIAQLRSGATQTGGGESGLLKFQRALMMLWNFLLAGYLGTILGKKWSV